MLNEAMERSIELKGICFQSILYQIYTWELFLGIGLWPIPLFASLTLVLAFIEEFTFMYFVAQQLS